MEESKNAQPEKIQRSLESMVGETVIIKPSTLLNRGRLYTTQSWIDINKLNRSLNGASDGDSENPRGWVSLKDGQVIYIVGDGNHRIGIACIDGGNVLFHITGVWPNGKKPPFKFNIIVKKIREMEIGLNK